MNESFETKIDKLNELLEKLKNEDINLQESVELYKSGMKLVKEARGILENAKLSITEVENIDG